MLHGGQQQQQQQMARQAVAAAVPLELELGCWEAGYPAPCSVRRKAMAAVEAQGLQRWVTVLEQVIGVGW